MTDEPNTGKEREPLSEKEWLAMGKQLFGSDMMKWRFRCPVCKYECSVQDWINAGATEGAFAFSCIGRFREGARDAFRAGGGGPCNYAGGGLLKLNPVLVTIGEGDRTMQLFEFAEPELPA